jgi:hypothetical protein
MKLRSEPGIYLRRPALGLGLLEYAVTLNFDRNDVT